MEMQHYYQAYRAMPNNRKVFYLALIFFLFVFFVKSFIDVNHIFALMIVLVAVGLFLSSDLAIQAENENVENEKLHFMNSLLYTDSYSEINDEFYIRPPVYESYLDRDNQIIEFYYRLRDYANYNLPSFRKSLMNTNTLLGIENFVNNLDYAPKKPVQYYEQAKIEYREALNNLHTLIYSIPSTRITNYTFNNSLKNLEFLLMQHLDNIKNLAKLHFDQCEMSVNSQPIHDYTANPNDTNSKGYNMNYSMY